MRKLFSAAALLLVAAAIAVPAALAQGSPDVFTVIIPDYSKSIEIGDNPPCVGTVTYDVKRVLHVTDFGDGRVQVVSNDSGDVTFLSALDGQLYTGRFVGTFVIGAGPFNAAFSSPSSYDLSVEAPDGSRLRLHITDQVTFAPGFSFDQPVVEHSYASCRAS